MKFRRSTFLLVFALISVATGWIVDRTIRKTNEEAIVEREHLYARIYAAQRHGVNYLCYETSDFRKEMQTEIVDSLILLWKNENTYSESYFGRDFNPSDYMARSFLEILDCDSPKSFREFALSLYRFKTEADQQVYNEENNISRVYVGFGDPHPNEENFPEFHDEQSAEYASFDAFLRRAFARYERD